MPAGEHELVTALSEAGVRTESLERIRVLDTEEIAWLLAAPPDEWFAWWRSIRALVDRTGCWPLAITGWGSDVDPFTRHDMDRVEVDLDLDPRDIVARAPTLDVDAILRREEERLDDEWRPGQRDVEANLEQTRRRLGDSPTLADVKTALGERPTRLALERWLFEWELGFDPVRAVVPGDRSYLHWFDPDDPIQIVLLPDCRPWTAWAYVGGFEWGWPHPDIRPAIAKRWSDRFAAEPVASWGTMQQLIVARPPADPRVAWEVAREMSLLWPDTAGGANGIRTREHARDLIGLDRWFLHYRP